MKTTRAAKVYLQKDEHFWLRVTASNSLLIAVRFIFSASASSLNKKQQKTFANQV